VPAAALDQPRACNTKAANAQASQSGTGRFFERRKSRLNSFDR
jgi:hypothetical protein